MNILSKLFTHHRRARRRKLSRVLADVMALSPEDHLRHDEVRMMFRDLKNVMLNMKYFGYDLARAMKERAFINRKAPSAAQHYDIKSQMATQKDMESDWVLYWCDTMKIAPVFHRKIWELCYVPQALFEQGMLHKGKKGIGFGCGEEPLPSLFASMGIEVVVTDLSPDSQTSAAWTGTRQHTSSIDKVFQSSIIERKDFDKLVSLQYVDMNNIPRALDNQFDFCWSVCALEHLGSLQKGLDFIGNSLRVLKPGGVAVHTTEYNFTNEKGTLEKKNLSIYKKKHFEAVADSLRRESHTVVALDFDPGSKPLDLFIDLPPYGFGQGWLDRGLLTNQKANGHLKLSIEGFPCTSFGMIIIKGSV